MAKQKLKQEKALLKKALQVGQLYAKNLGYPALAAHTAAAVKIECIYRLLVENQQIHPLAKDKENSKNMQHKLALWIARQLPANHPLLN